MPNRDKTIVLRKRPWGRHWLPLWATTAPHIWDLVVDIRGSALAWLLPARHRAVFRRTGGAKITELGAMLGLTPPPLPVAWISQADRSRVGALIPPGRPIIALAPTANWAPKIWPADRFAAVFHRLAAADAIPIVLGGPGAMERAMAAPLLAALPKAIDLVGQLTLPEVSACLERAALFLGNDSGLMHMAAAAGAPTIGLFGPTDAATYGPSGPRAMAVTGPSMTAISVDQVFTAATTLLAQPRTAETNIPSDASTSWPAVST
jgi:ADP-heptose:LPS heptosyltransferase